MIHRDPIPHNTHVSLYRADLPSSWLQQWTTFRPLPRSSGSRSSTPNSNPPRTIAARQSSAVSYLPDLRGWSWTSADGVAIAIGPKTNSVEAINKLRIAGLNVVRMNFSHGSYEYHQSVIDHAREAEKVQKGRQVAIALDTKGPEIRTGNTPGDEDIPIAAGAEMNITTDEKYATASDNKNM